MTNCKKLFRFVKNSLSLVIAFSIILSVFAISGISFGVSAATSAGAFYLNTSQNSVWSGKSNITARFAGSSGNVLSGGNFVALSGKTDIYSVTAPSGAVKLEISMASFPQPNTVVKDGYHRVFLNSASVLSKDSKSYEYTNPYIHYYTGSTASETGTSWPGVKMTRISGSSYYYADIPNVYRQCNFSTQTSSMQTQYQTVDLDMVFYGDTAYYNGSAWVNPRIRSIDLSSVSNGENVVYIDSDEKLTLSRYNYANNNIAKKKVYVYNENWSSNSSVYATYDFNDPYKTTVTLTKDTYNGHVVFKGEIPEGANVRFHPNPSDLRGASSVTSYPVSGGFDGSAYNANTATYKITASSEDWIKLSQISNISYDAIVPNNFGSSAGIVGVDATYIDYWSDMERERGYLQCQGNENLYDYWYQFDDFNNYISNYAKPYSATWKYPLYFGNMYKGEEHYDAFKSHAGSLTNINNYDENYYYAVNNSNGMFWGGGNYNQSLQGLAYKKLDSNGDLQAASGVKMPYFDASTLSTAKYNNKRVASVYKSYFPFRYTTDSNGVTTYKFTSKNATDNVYFNWSNTTPTSINYGAGKNYGINDELSKFGGTSNGYGIFPFNNTAATSGGKASNYNIDYGFGIRLDIDFRVPKNGTVDGSTNGQPVLFEYLGDDDLWVYIGEDKKGANADLVLDMGGDHKESTGRINFKTMTAEVDDVFADYSDNTTTASKVPSDEFWVKTGSYADFCLHVWQDTSVGTLNDGAYFIKPYSTSGGYYKFKRSQLGGNTAVDFEQYMNTSGYLSYIANVSALYGKEWNADGTQASSVTYKTNLGKVTKSFNGGQKLDPNKTYHMVVFYMERGEVESNFSLGFTMTPANNNLKVSKTLDASAVSSAIANDLKKNEKYSYTINDGTGMTGGKGFSLNGSASTLSGSSGSVGGFNLADGGRAAFNNTFKTESQMTVDESIPNKALTYSTSWELVNNKNGKLISSSASGTSSSFKLVDPTDKSSFADLQLDYVNKVEAADLRVSKSTVDEDGITNYDTEQQFRFKIELDLDASGTTYSYKSYPIEYSVDGEDFRTTANGEFSIGAGKTAVLKGIPKGATYRLSEYSAAGFKPYKVSINNKTQISFTSSVEGKVGDNSSVKVINILKPSVSGITVKKTLDGTNYTGSSFAYTLQGLASMATAYDSGDGTKLNTVSSAGTTIKQTKADNGVVTFNGVQYDKKGYYRFKITEDFADSMTENDKTSYVMDKKLVLVEVQVTANELGDLEAQAPVYYIVPSDLAGTVTTDADCAKYFAEQYKASGVAAFENATTKGKVTVIKKNQAGNFVGGTKFAVYKTTGDNGAIGEQVGTTVETSAADGKAVFENLSIFEDGYASAGNVKPQWYVLKEVEPAEGYTPNKTLTYFTLPVYTKDNVLVNSDTPGAVPKYEITYEYTDGAVTMPQTSGGGSKMFLLIGLGVLTTGLMLTAGYVFYDRDQRRKRRARYAARR